MTATAGSQKLQGFSTKGIVGDISAGLTKSIDSVTGGMANALLAGVNPVYGLYTVLAATPNWAARLLACWSATCGHCGPTAIH